MFELECAECGAQYEDMPEDDTCPQCGCMTFWDYDEDDYDEDDYDEDEDQE